MKTHPRGQKPFSIILFDLGNVLVKVDYPAFLRTIGFDHKMSERDLYELLEMESRAYEMGKITPEQYLTVVNRKLGISYTFDQFRRAWNSILPEPLPGMLELVESLASTYRLMVLSNTNKLHFDHGLESFPVLEHFERFFLSYEVGALKPDPAIYKHVLSELETPPPELLFIDDLEPNILAARQVGITGIVFRGVESLKEKLRRLMVI